MKKHFKSIIFILSVCAFLGVNNYIYLKKCSELFIGDQMEFLISTLSHHQNESYLAYLSSMLRAPGIFMIVGLLYNIFPANEFTAILSNIIFAFFLFLGTYMITLKIAKSHKKAAEAVIILLLYPLTFGLSRFFLTEFALMSAVCMFCFSLLYTNDFQKRHYSLFLGICIGLGLLTKESFLIFVSGPLLWQLARLKSGISKNQKRNIIATIIPACLIASAWLSTSSATMILKDGFTRVTLAPNNAALSFLSLKNIFFYLYTLVDFSISPFFMLLFTTALILYIKNKNTFLPLIWIAFPYIFFSFLPWKLARYIAPLCPAVAIVTAAGINYLPNKLKPLIRFTYIGFGLLQFFVLTYGDIGFLRQEHFISTTLMSKIFRMDASQYHEDFWISQPNTGNTESRYILKTIQRNTDNSRNTVVCQILNEYESAVADDLSLPLDMRYKESTHNMSPLSTPLSFYNLSLNYNFKIVYCFVDDNNIWKYYNPAGNHLPISDINDFAFIISYNPLFLKNTDFVLLSQKQKKSSKSFFLFKKQ